MTCVPLCRQCDTMNEVEDRSVSTRVRQAAGGGAERPLVDDASWPDESRRRRKKRQTRDALIDTALDLFETKGYEHTAVHEITDAIDVAERTFFRYFASKEDLALFFVKQEMDDFTDALAARPTGEAPLTAVRNAFRQTLEQLQGDDHLRNGEPRYLTVIRLIDSTPTARRMESGGLWEGQESATTMLYRNRSSRLTRKS